MTCGLYINGTLVPEGPRWKPAPPTPAPPKPRVFDHLVNLAPADRWQDAHFSRAARRMRSSAWWHEVSARTEPAATSGEINH